ncbi:phage tail protein [Sphingomonas sp. TDK1]|uniref:phage tail protein n=1 Tax=Sphingomonas sp. TDK1 TaxID=453247 RepID=UPI0007D99FD7|nr:phage tail protein [Sphingomonas sp. TDK1]OAN64846.1 hypothetical protein A7X12_17570 [Sphingomonas sp. TDK1]
MATIVLGVAGAVFGGRMGAQIGGLIGAAIDGQLFAKPGTREGARLADLRVQSSSYGSAIPKLFGTVRVAGCVIWATDLTEHRATEGGGKGRPSTTAYSYTASFAVAFSTRRIHGIGRIWADGQLLRGAAGDFKVRTGFRLYTGGEDQPVDPLIAALEGAGRAPAHRGLAYAVFEDLELASFGNRIPQLTFEVIADPEPVAAGTIARTIGGVAVEGLDLPLAGFSAQESVRTTLDALCAASGAWLRAGEDRFAMVAGLGNAAAVPDDGAGTEPGAGAARGGRSARTLAAADSVPRRLSIGYYDPARDYQAGVQQATRRAAGTRETRIDLPAVLDAGAAKAMAAGALARAELARERRTLTLGWEALTLAPGMRITIANSPGQWRVDRWTFEQMVVKLECVPITAAPMAAPASPGRSVAAPDARQGRTVLAPFELPPIDEVPATTPRIVVAAAGTGSGWRRAALLASVDGGSWSAIGETAYPAVLGTVRTPPGGGRAALIDRASVAEVDLVQADGALANATMAALDAGANLAMLGDELVQFGRAEPLGAGRWRLSELWRGRRGTEAAIGAQRPGDRFVLVARESLKPIAPVPAIGGAVRLLAQGVEDPADTAPVELVSSGISLLPPSPVQLTIRVRSQALQVRWARRSRVDWSWRDGVDAALGEETERYQVEILRDGNPQLVETTAPELTIPATGINTSLTIKVRQMGMHGLSPAAECTVRIKEVTL